MLERLDEKARQIDEATPADRNRYADFLRIFSILLVVVGHWLVGFISVDEGRIVVERILSRVTATQWLTWIFQVMPIFFFVGGMANAISWDNAKNRGESYVDWINRRARRLLWPVVPLFLAWLVFVLVLELVGVPSYLVVLGSQVAIVPLWFLAAYMAVITIAPAAYWLHRRLGLGVLLIFIILAIGVDLLVSAGFELAGWLNFLFVWGAIHQAGFFWHDERTPSSAWVGVALAAVAFGSLLILVHLGVYPLSMIGTGEPDVRTNDSPPSVALTLLAAGQIGLIFALRPVLKRALKNKRLWLVVMATGSRLMTVYLWHMTALIFVAMALHLSGVWPIPDRVDGTWWLLRIPWVLLCLIVLAVLVVAFGRFEQPPSPEPRGARDWPSRIQAAISAFLAILGLSMIVDAGFYTHPGPSGIVWVWLAIFLLGLYGLRVIRPSTLAGSENSNST